MPRREMPVKVCRVCGREFTWRRKWALVWNEVKYCSDRCRARRTTGGQRDGGWQGGR